MLSDQLRAPLSPEAPCGTDVKYDDDFERLKSEINKQASVAARTDFDRLVSKGSALLSGKSGADGASTLLAEASGVDYGTVVDLATGILTAKSKDLEVAAYLCLGLFRVRGYEGLAEGLEGYQALVETYWEQAYPELRRIEARRRVVEWLAQRVADAIALLPPQRSDRASLDRTVAACRAIDALLRERISENPPSLSVLLRALTEAKDALPAEAPAPAASPAVAAAPVGPPGVAASAPAAGPSPTKAPSSADDALLAVARAADFLRSASPESPVGYRLLRVARWDLLTSAPVAEGGRTMIAGPPEHFRLRLESARAGATWRELVTACEEIFYESPNEYWLDLARYEDQALSALGGEFARLRQVLRHETARLLERLPELVGLSFEDGSPFADAATREWIDHEIRPLIANGATAAAPAGPVEESVQQQLDEAEERAGRGDLAGALEALQAAQKTDSRPRARFARQLLMARLCLAHGKPAVARSLLEELDTLSERANLNDWEPQICHQIWSLLHRCYQSLVQSSRSPAREEYQARMERAFDKICRLDIRLAVSEGGRT